MTAHSGNDERFTGGLELATVTCMLLMALAAGTALAAITGTDPKGFLGDMAGTWSAGLAGTVMTLVLLQPWRFGSDTSRFFRMALGVTLGGILLTMGISVLNGPLALAEYLFPPATESVAFGIVAFLAGAVGTALVCLPSQIAYWVRRGGWARPRATGGFTTESKWDLATYTVTFLITFAAIAYAGFDFGYRVQTILFATAGTLIVSILVQRKRPAGDEWHSDVACAGPLAAVLAPVAAVFIGYFIESGNLLEPGIIHSNAVLHFAEFVVAPFLGGGIAALLVWMAPVLLHLRETRVDARAWGPGPFVAQHGSSKSHRGGMEL
jgi:hypothetical protein